MKSQENTKKSRRGFSRRIKALNALQWKQERKKDGRATTANNTTGWEVEDG